MLRCFLLLVVVACAPGSIGPYKVVSPAPLAPSPRFDPPRSARTVVTETSIEIYDTITFVGNTAVIAPTSVNMIDAIARTLRGNPSIVLLQVRGHSDWEEPDRVRRAELSIERAGNVVGELIARGVDPARLEPYGASDSEPISQTDPVVNRRIDLLILQRATDD